MSNKKVIGLSVLERIRALGQGLSIIKVSALRTSHPQIPAYINPISFSEREGCLVYRNGDPFYQFNELLDQAKSWTLFASEETKESGKVSLGEDPLESSFREETERMTALFIKKNQDYGSGNIYQKNTEFSMLACMIRLNDKVQRAINLLYNNQEPNFESLEDTFRDISNYGVIAQLLLQGKWPKDQE